MTLSSSSQSSVYIGVEAVVRCIGNIDGKEVLALATEPPVVSQTDTVVTDFSESSISGVSSDGVNAVVELLNILIEFVKSGSRRVVVTSSHSELVLDVLVFTDEHINIVLLSLNSGGQVNENLVKSTDVFA